MMRSSCATRLRAGFTLLEVMLAVAILLLISIALTRFMESTIQAAQFSVRASDQDEACAGLRRLVAAQLAALPLNQSGSLIGMMIKSSSGRRDAVQMVCPSGNALLTPDAKGFYQITLLIRENPRGSGKMVLVMERQPWTDDDDDTDDGDGTGATPLQATSLSHPVEKLPSDSVNLMDGVRQMEIAYFDSRLNGWVDRWTDSSLLPNLVRLRLTFVDGQPPYEIIERVPGGGVKPLPVPVALPPPVNTINGGNGPGTVNPPAGGGTNQPAAIKR